MTVLAATDESAQNQAKNVFTALLSIMGAFKQVREQSQSTGIKSWLVLACKQVKSKPPQASFRCELYGVAAGSQVASVCLGYRHYESMVCVCVCVCVCLIGAIHGS